MADEMKTATDTAAATARKMADDATAATRNTADQAARAGEAMKDSAQTMAKGGSTIGVRMIDQAETNAREAFTAMRDAARAKDLTEVMKIQGDYLRAQGERSMDQAREIGELIMQFGRDAVAPLRPR